MKMVQLDQEGCGGILQVALDAIIASRYDLLLLAAGLGCYLVLSSARAKWQMVQKFRKHTGKHDAQYYKASLSMHINNHEHAEAQKIIDSMQAGQIDLEEEVVHSMLRECICSNDTEMAVMLEKLLRCQSQCTDTTYHLRIQALSGHPAQARSVIDAVLDRLVGSSFSFDLVLCILGFCRTSLTDRPLVDELFECMSNADVDVLSEFIHFYLDSNQLDQACNVFERNFATFFDNELGEDTEWSLMHAALKCGRVSVAKHFFETSQCDAARRVLTIQKWWRHSGGNLQGSSRAREIGDIFGRLAHVFNERFPFEEEDSFADSGDESTVLLGDDEDCGGDLSDFDSDYDSSDWSDDLHSLVSRNICETNQCIAEL